MLRIIAAELVTIDGCDIRTPTGEMVEGDELVQINGMVLTIVPAHSPRRPSGDTGDMADICECEMVGGLMGWGLYTHTLWIGRQSYHCAIG